LDIQILPTFACILRQEPEVFESLEELLIRLFCPEVSKVRCAVNDEGVISALVILHPTNGWLCTVSARAQSDWHDFEEFAALVQDDEEWRKFIESYPVERLLAVAEVLYVVSNW
jgi:hypothetical protein